MLLSAWWALEMSFPDIRFSWMKNYPYPVTNYALSIRRFRVFLFIKNIIYDSNHNVDVYPWTHHSQIYNNKYAFVGHHTYSETGLLSILWFVAGSKFYHKLFVCVETQWNLRDRHTCHFWMTMIVVPLIVFFQQYPLHCRSKLFTYIIGISHDPLPAVVPWPTELVRNTRVVTFYSTMNTKQ